jgi:serine/threonine protein kinase
MENFTGHSFGHYHILKPLGGEGGMAAAYKVCDTRLERDVAVKIIREDAFLHYGGHEGFSYLVSATNGY